MAIQSSQMYRHSSWKIIFLHTFSSSIVSLKRHGQSREGEHRILTQTSWQYRSNWRSSSSPLHCLCASPIIQNPNNILCCCPLPMTDPSCYACLNGYYIVNPCKLEQDNKQIIKDDLAAPDSRLCPAMLSSKDEDRWANECCCSAHSRLKQQQR